MIDYIVQSRFTLHIHEYYTIIRIFKMNETKKRIRNCVFNDEWLKDQIFSNWLAKHDGPNKARCIICQTVFSVKYDGV